MAEISTLLDEAMSEDVAQPTTPESLNAETEVVASSEITESADTPGASSAAIVERAAVTETPAEEPPSYLDGVAAEDWKGVPISVRTAVDNMVGQVRSFVAENAPRLEAYNALSTILEPHMEAIRASGSTPLAVVDGTLKLAQNLWTGKPETKADTIAGLIQNYGVDIALLERAILNRLEVQKNPIHSAIQQQLAPIQQQLQQVLGFTQQQQQAPIQQQRQQQIEAVNNEVLAFATEKSGDGTLKHPHYQQVRIDMGDMFSLAAQRGQTITLEEAYKRACAFRGLHPAPETKPVGHSVKGSATNSVAPPAKRYSSVGSALDDAFNLHTTH